MYLSRLGTQCVGYNISIPTNVSVTVGECKSFSYPQSYRVEFLFFQVVSEHVPVNSLLLHGKLSQRVLSDTAVSARHAQRTATLTGHAGEALPPAEIIHRHFLEAHPARPHALLLLQDGH